MCDNERKKENEIELSCALTKEKFVICFLILEIISLVRVKERLACIEALGFERFYFLYFLYSNEIL
jgi:hypothetical protein